MLARELPEAFVATSCWDSFPFLAESVHSRERARGPRRASGGDPLVCTVREAALEVRLDGNRPRLHVPGPILELGAEQELDAATNRWIVGCGHSAFEEGGQRFAGRIRVALEQWLLRPAAVTALQCQQLARRLSQRVHIRFGPREPE